MPADGPGRSATASTVAAAGDFVPIVIDVEASGFGRGSYPIEVGMAMADGSRHCFLVLPTPDWTAWDDQAEAVHGISRELLADCGRPVTEVASQLNTLLRGRTVYTDAWSFDMSWLGKLFDAADAPQGFRVADIGELLDESQRGRWLPVKDDVMRKLGVERHRASIDAQVVQQTWLRLNTAPG
jgi:hypothetical protein